ncbi:MAG: T9SS type A sorting domain-containing protein, partial [Candidatus Cloacimonetes bacterium]|nr:T9SS type A sorting domain-containing protein [Candidatus Cloacimonadota bacterium]
IRFTLASDPYTVAEGYWVDNVDIDVDGTIVFSDYGETNLIPADPIIPYQELEYSSTADEFVSGGWVQSESYNITLYAGCEIKLAARARLDADTTLSAGKEDGAGLWFDDVAIYGSNLPPHDMANMFNVIPYPASADVDLFPGPGIVYGNFGTTTEAPQLRMDVEGLGGAFDYYYNAADPIETGEFGFAWLTKIPTFELAESLWTFTGWTIVGNDADPTNDTLSIDIDVLPAGEYELGYNSRIWDGTYYTATYCGSYFTPFSDGLLDEYTINSVTTLLLNMGTDFATDTETIEIYEAIDDTTLGALLYTEDFAYTGGAGGTYEWAVFDLATPVIVEDDFFVLISGDWWTVPATANYYPVFDAMVRQYLGSGAYTEHTVYFADPGWAHSSGDRFVNTLGPGDPHSVDPGTGCVDGSYLRQNSPNPFNNETVINYYIKGAPHNIVEIKIFNLLGQLVDTVEGKNGVAVWNSKDLSSGIYFYKLTVDDFSEVKKMVIIK